MIKKVFISTNKEIGLKCKKWAENNLLMDYIITDDINDCDIFISVLYDKILSKDFINNKKCYNFHPAILPNYAGVGTITWSILNNDKQHGVTLHLIDEGIDTGDLIDVVKFEIEESDTAYSLYDKTMKELFLFFKNKFINILNENYNLVPQDFSLRKVYTYEDLDKLFDLSTFMRATYFPGKSNPYFYRNKQKIKYF
jgi:methionyl-tRNA formyltransferase